MTIQLHFPVDVESKLVQQAAIAGQDVATYVAQVVSQSLDAELNDAPAEDRDYEHWHADFQAWIASNSSRNPEFDDSRESVYD